MDVVEEWRPLSNSEFGFRILCHDKLKHMCAAETLSWKRTAKVKWFKLGDENTKFFNTMATYRFRKNEIKFFRLGDEEFFKDEDKLKTGTNF
jgi:hypothetical protein